MRVDDGSTPVRGGMRGRVARAILWPVKLALWVMAAVLAILVAVSRAPFWLAGRAWRWLELWAVFDGDKAAREQAEWKLR